MSDRLRLLHLGLGAWGANWATHVLPNHPHVDVVGYVDMIPEKRLAMAGRLGEAGERFHESLTQAFRKTKVDAVSIAVPIALHEPLAREALDAGKHVLLEKPFAPTFEAARSLVELAEQRGLVLAISQNYRYYPAPRLIAELSRGGYFGAIIGGKIDFRRNAIIEQSANLKVPNPMLGDMAVHHYDLMRMLIGADPIEISARSWNPPGSPYEMDAAAAMVVSFPGGVTVSYRGSWIDPGPQTAWAGEWQLDFERASVAWTARGDQPWQTRRDHVEISRPNAPAEVVELKDMPLNDRAGVLEAFAETVRTGSPPADFPTGRANLGTLAMVDAALRSAKAGGSPARMIGGG